MLTNLHRYAIPGIVLLLSCFRLHANNDEPFKLQSKFLTIELNKEGRVTGMVFNKDGQRRAVVAYTGIASFTSKKDIAVQSTDKRSIRFEHDLYSDSLQQHCKLIEIFSVTANSIRWQVEIDGTGAAWSSAIKTIVQYPKNNDTRFWTSWGAPQFDSANCDPALVASLSPYKNNIRNGWFDPLVPVPFSTQTLYYGAPPFEYADTKIGFIPSQGNLFAIPFASVFEKKLAGFLFFFRLKIISLTC